MSRSRPRPMRVRIAVRSTVALTLLSSPGSPSGDGASRNIRGQPVRAGSGAVLNRSLRSWLTSPGAGRMLRAIGPRVASDKES